MRPAMLLVVVSVGCASKTDVPAAPTDSATPLDSFDVGAEETSADTSLADSRAIDANELSAFAYSWYGTGVSGSFGLNADCGIITNGQLSYYSPRIDGAGAVPGAECDSFKHLCVSAPVVGALRTVDAGGCATDDYPNVTITLADGTKITQPGVGCSDREPYKTLLPRVEQLRKYVDAGGGG
jgi:hypothetical protein